MKLPGIAIDFSSTRESAEDTRPTSPPAAYLRRRRIARGLLASALFVLGVASPVVAQKQPPKLTDLSLEELSNLQVATVYAASKFQQKTEQAPASVTIITADEIRKYGYRTLADVLRSVRGFHVSYDRNYSYVGIRGFSPPGDFNTRILVLIDGHRLNESVYDSAPVDAGAVLDMDLVERVEIIRGPSSSLYGANAFFAVINIITRTPRQLESFELSTEGGGLGTYRARFSYGTRFHNGRELLLSGSYFGSAGHARLFYPEFNSPLTNSGIAEYADGDRSATLFANVSFKHFRLQADYATRRKVVPIAPVGTVFNNAGTRTIDGGGYVDLSYERAFADAWQLAARLSYEHSAHDGNYVMDAGPLGLPFLALNKMTGIGDRWGFEGNLSTLFAEKHRVTFGTELRHNLRQYQSDYIVSPRIVYFEDHRSSAVWAFFAQDDFQIASKWILQAGLRFDDYQTFGATLNPRLSLIYNPGARATFKLLYGHAFRAPSAYEMYFVAAGSFKPNPNLKPEKIRAAEVVAEFRPTTHLRLSASAYWNRLRDLISQQFDPADSHVQFQNWERANSKGVELELFGKWDSGIETRLSYSLQDADSDTLHRELPNCPHHLAKFNAILPLFQRKLFVGIEGHWVSRRDTLSGPGTRGFFLMNGSLFAQNLAKGLELSASVYNLFDTHYSDPAGPQNLQQAIEQDGRNFRVKLTYRFSAR
jgi:outer membrane receptor for ferrienterochelin and colicins